MSSHFDEACIRKCIELAEESLRKGDAPFGALVSRRNKTIAESGNAIFIAGDVTNHAEILAMRKAQKTLATSDLSDCAIYSNCEPCPMCSFMMRELKFARVVFGAFSPSMGGLTKWNILRDPGLETFRPVFSSPPEVVGGVLEEEAKKTFFAAGWSPSFLGEHA